MAIHLMTGFEGCNSVEECHAILDAYAYYSYKGSCIFESTGGFNSSRGLRLRVDDHYDKYHGYRLLCNLPVALVGKTAAAGCYFKLSHLGYSTIEYGAGSILVFHGPDIRIMSTSTAGLKIFRGTTELKEITTGPIANQWYHIEACLFSDASAGTIVIKLNGHEICNESGLNTGGQDITGIRLSTPYANYGDTYYDNIYFADELQGMLQMSLARPNGDYDADDFTCSSGTDRYALIDEDYDGDTSYIESDTVGHQAIFDYEDYTAGGTIVAVQVNTIAKQTDSGRSIKHVFVQESSIYDGDEFALGLNYPGQTALDPPHFEVLNTLPDGSAWTTPDFNDLKIGLEVST